MFLPLVVALVVAVGSVAYAQAPAPPAVAPPPQQAQVPPKPPTAFDTARALLAEGDTLRAAGKLDDALARYRQALAALAGALRAPMLAAGAVAPDQVAGYLDNRLAADLAATIRTRIAGVAAALPDARQGAALLEDAAACWPPTPEAKAAALRLAAQGVHLALAAGQLSGGAVYLRAPGERAPESVAGRASPPQIDARTLHYLISVFDASGEHTAPFTTLLPDNQPLLDRIATVTDEKLLTEAIGLVAEVDSARRGRAPLTQAQVAELVRAWREAERRGTGGDPEACARGLLQIAGEQAGSLLEPIAVLAAAQWLHQAGRYEGAAGARQFFDDVARAEGPVRDHAEVGLAELAFSEATTTPRWRGSPAWSRGAPTCACEIGRRSGARGAWRSPGTGRRPSPGTRRWRGRNARRLRMKRRSRRANRTL